MALSVMTNTFEYYFWYLLCQKQLTLLRWIKRTSDLSLVHERLSQDTTLQITVLTTGPCQVTPESWAGFPCSQYFAILL